MDKGQIVEQGTHRGLLEKQGLYADLYNAQFQDEPQHHEENRLLRLLIQVSALRKYGKEFVGSIGYYTNSSLVQRRFLGKDLAAAGVGLWLA